SVKEDARPDRSDGLFTVGAVSAAPLRLDHRLRAAITTRYLQSLPSKLLMFLLETELGNEGNDCNCGIYVWPDRRERARDAIITVASLPTRPAMGPPPCQNPIGVVDSSRFVPRTRSRVT